MRALPVGLGEVLADGMDARFALHERCANGFRAAWASMGLTLLPKRPELAANTLSAIMLPEGITPALVGAIAERGVIVAGGLHPDLKTKYFRVGHMGDVLRREDDLHMTVRAIGEALSAQGHATDVGAAIAAFDSAR